jgi:octaprenyl-diphosphate synthase
MEEVKSLMHRFVADLGGGEIAGYLDRVPMGKLLRSRLIVQIAADHPQAHQLCAVVEMIHLASLLHDDVIDEAPTRRGVPSIHASEGSKTAIMLGDIFYSKAYGELVTLGTPIAQTISNAVTRLSLGELLDVRLGESFNTDRARYEEMIDLKTAALIEAACEAAALLSGKAPEPYRIFGRNLGIAFQLIDDLLDLTQDEATLGKPAMGDLKEGKVTLPVILLHDRLSGADRDQLLGYFKRTLEPQEQAWLRDKLKTSGALDETRDYALKLAREAKAQVEADAALSAIADQLIDRVR